jgi:hypothetical protein
MIVRKHQRGLAGFHEAQKRPFLESEHGALPATPSLYTATVRRAVPLSTSTSSRHHATRAGTKGARAAESWLRSNGDHGSG